MGEVSVATGFMGGRGRRLAALLLTLSASALFAASTSSADTGGSLLSCPGVAEHPFVRWLDPFAYTLAHDGAFEAGARAWRLTGGAAIVSENETFYVHGAGDRYSLHLPAGSSATTSPICVGLLSPTLRYFSVKKAGGLLSGLKVEVLYPTLLGTMSQRVLLASGSSTWQPTLPLPFLANVTGLLSLNGSSSLVSFRFTPTGTSAWRIDDVYVDPWFNE
jgi:hypothetical protein